MSAVFLEGNALSILKGLPADWFHCAATSPPYFGLRRYDGGEEVWDGDLNCQHEWGVAMIRRDRGTAKGINAVVGNQLNEVSGTETQQGNFCQKCGAWRGQLGNEPTPDLYISHLVEICREVRRVLRPDGVFWLNIGDSWAANRGYQVQQTKWQGMDGQEGMPSRVPNGCKPLDMVLIPSLLALALRSDGWYVRSQVIWSKTNPMPESVNGWRWERHKVKVGDNGRGREAWRVGANETPQQDPAPDGSFQSSSVWQDCPGCPKCSPNDGYVLRKGSWRPTDSYEIILMLTKTGSYYSDREAVLEPIAPSTVGRGKVDFGGQKGRDYNPDEDDPNFRNGSEQWGRTYDYTQSNGSGGRNLRSVWTFPTKPYSGAHYATYPPRLVEICVQSSTSEKGCCPKCGAPWARVVEKGFTAHDGDTSGGKDGNSKRIALLRQAARQRGGEYGYNSKFSSGGTGLTEQGFTRDNTVEAERVVSREQAKSLYPADEQAQQEYINHVHDHGGLDKGRTLDWRSTCSCSTAPPEPCRVLDPFSGAGTTALVCELRGLDSISIDTSTEYIQLARTRLQEDEDKRFADFLKKAQKKSPRGA